MIEQAAAVILSLLGLIWVADDDPYIRIRGFLAWVGSNTLWIWHSYQIHDSWFTAVFLMFLIFTIRGYQVTSRSCTDDDRISYRVGNYFVGIHPRWMGIQSHGKYPPESGSEWRWRVTLGIVGVGRSGP